MFQSVIKLTMSRAKKTPKARNLPNMAEHPTQDLNPLLLPGASRGRQGQPSSKKTKNKKSTEPPQSHEVVSHEIFIQQRHFNLFLYFLFMPIELNVHNFWLKKLWEELLKGFYIMYIKYMMGVFLLK